MSHDNLCNVPGSAYPWHAVRRYIFENQGLMRRMYGEQRHSLIVSSEIEEARLRYDNSLSLVSHRSAAGRSVSRVRPNSRYAARRKTPRPSPQPSSAATTTTTPSEISTSPSPSLVLTTASEDRKATTTTPAYSAGPRPDEGETGPNINTSAEREPTTTSGYATTTTMPSSEATTAADKEDGPSYAAGVPLTQDPGPAVHVTEPPFEPKRTPVVDSNHIDMVDGDAHVEVEEDEMVAAEDAKTESSTEGVPLRKGMNACPVKQEVLAPYWANNTRGEVLALLNVYPFEQYIHVEKCAFENHKMFCREGCRCEQQYRLHRLLAFDPRNECRGIFADWFRFPSCCVCICYDIGTPSMYRSGRQTVAENHH
ncbi:protein spaetzle 4-like isoform X2 [Ornithodoros turicata]